MYRADYLSMQNTKAEFKERLCISLNERMVRHIELECAQMGGISYSAFIRLLLLRDIKEQMARGR